MTLATESLLGRKRVSQEEIEERVAPDSLDFLWFRAATVKESLVPSTYSPNDRDKQNDPQKTSR